ILRNGAIMEFNPKYAKVVDIKRLIQDEKEKSEVFAAAYGEARRTRNLRRLAMLWGMWLAKKKAIEQYDNLAHRNECVATQIEIEDAAQEILNELGEEYDYE